MIQQERRHEEHEHQVLPAVPSGGTSLIAAARTMLARGGDVIDRALSQDSRAFLEGTRQEGGQ